LKYQSGGLNFPSGCQSQPQLWPSNLKVVLSNPELSTHSVPGFTTELKDDNIFEWEIGIIGPPDTIYEGGYFLATMSFPSDYPFNPPEFRFNTPFFHPNMYY
jgi:ubiquitin-protein ligase